MTAVRELTVVAEQVLAPVPGGTGRYTAELLRALAETAPEGWCVRGVVARHADVGPAETAGVRGPRVLPVSRRVLTELWRRGLPWWPGGDAVHAPTPLAPPRAPSGRTLSVTVHDTVPWSHPETLTPRGVAWHRAAIATAARRADAVVVPTRAVADELATHVPVTAPVHVVGHGTTAWPEAEPIAEPVGTSGPYVLAVGTLEPRKGIDVLIRAMAEVPGAVLVLAGQPGWGGLDPEAIAERSGLPTDRLRVLGRVTDAQLAGLLRGAAVVAVPSLAEGFGLPVLEAMAEGVPVVHSDAPALVEVAGGAGVCVPRGDAAALASALRGVLSGPDRARMADAGRARAREFTWTSAARAVWRLHVP
ncbi:glycosyltransferase involved in cell wall biosynthesis [Prauserella rugosa]|uniref:Glycosyltransferase involved in cell wall biosynthesis n=1 Tax=Prauserella rugosa TaxID=43354 RepID=A0A660CFT8_9PSEU|nr:glycosyltransferase involved in cell wall biosynthesis [Prauserella rugosa]